jgi:hypothetical protein
MSSRVEPGDSALSAVERIPSNRLFRSTSHEATINGCLRSPRPGLRPAFFANLLLRGLRGLNSCPHQLRKRQRRGMNVVHVAFMQGRVASATVDPMHEALRRTRRKNMKKSLITALALALPLTAFAQQSVTPAAKPAQAPKSETKKTESTETKSDSTVTKDGAKKSTHKHKKTTKTTTETAPPVKPTPKS